MQGGQENNYINRLHILRLFASLEGGVGRGVVFYWDVGMRAQSLAHIYSTPLSGVVEERERERGCRRSTILHGLHTGECLSFISGTL